MDEFITKFTLLLKYVPYIWEEKEKVQCFISIFPTFMKEIMEFNKLKMMDEAIWKARIYYQQMKKKGDTNRGWPNKKGKRNFQNKKNAKVAGNKSVHRKQLNKPLGKFQQKP